MNPVLVDSTQCHLWTDALHVRQLSRDAANRWDRGTYVRLCLILGWTALEIGCQDALSSPQIGFRFKENLDQAVADKGLPALDWSKGIWQEVRRIQELRKACVHRFKAIGDMFPDSSIADDTIEVIRTAISAIHDHASVPRPAWIDFDQSLGWAGHSGASDMSSSTLVTGGASLDDPSSLRISFVVNGVEHVSSVHPQGFDYEGEMRRLANAVSVPISAVRAYVGQTLVCELCIHMRGNS